MMVRGIRGAVRVKANTRDAIHRATKRLLLKIAEENHIEPEDIASILLTATVDLNADFPAYVVRDIGWTRVPVLCAQEMLFELRDHSLGLNAGRWDYTFSYIAKLHAHAQ